jgi:hypothetical protein
MNWEQGELRSISIATKQSLKKDPKSWKEYDVPAPYDRIVAQLLAEVVHGMSTRTHEALRRMTYAERVLDSFSREVKKYRGEPVEFRSKVLNPILQRQMVGIEDNYSPSVREAVSDDDGMPTIACATKFYLSSDPTDPELIPMFRRNLVTVPEARWHLGTVVGSIATDSAEDSASVRKNHEWLMRDENNLPEDVGDDESDAASNEDFDFEVSISPDDVPDFTLAELTVLVLEHLEDFFEDELEGQVCGFWFNISLVMLISAYSKRFSRR